MGIDYVADFIIVNLSDLSHSLHLMNRFDQYLLVFKLVTLGECVKGMIDMLINLLRITHFSQKTTKNSSAAHPEHLER